MNNMEGGVDLGPAAVLWHETVLKVPTLYGRLVLLSSLQNQSTGNYEHHGLSLRYGEAVSGQVLERSHFDWFEAWLGQSLAEKRRDLAEYWQSLEEPLPSVIESWLRVRPFRKLPPPAAGPAETEQFVADCEVLLELFRIEYGVAAPDRDV